MGCHANGLRGRTLPIWRCKGNITRHCCAFLMAYRMLIRAVGESGSTDFQNESE